MDTEASDAGTNIYQGARGALRAMYDSPSALDEAHKAHLQDVRVGTEKSTGRPIMRKEIPAALVGEFTAAAYAAFDRVNRSAEAGLRVVEDGIGKLEQQVTSSLVDKRANEASVAAASSDIRAYSKNLPDTERMNFLHKAIDDGDIEIIASVAQTTPWVSGLNREQHATIIDLARERFCLNLFRSPHARAEGDAAGGAS